MIVGCVGSATYTLLPQLARRMRADLPDVEFGFRGEMLPPDQVRALRQDRLDLGLMRQPSDTAGLDIHPIRRESLCSALRSQERRGGTECVSTCRSRCSTFN